MKLSRLSFFNMLPRDLLNVRHSRASRADADGNRENRFRRPLDEENHSRSGRRRSAGLSLVSMPFKDLRHSPIQLGDSQEEMPYFGQASRPVRILLSLRS